MEGTLPRLYRRKANRGARKPRTCRACHKPIEAGQEFYTWSPRPTRASRGYAQYQHVACGRPRQSALYPYNRMAPIWDAQEDAARAISEVEYPSTPDDAFGYVDDVRAALETLAETVEEVAAEYRESADNIESGFGHSTYQSEELAEKADALEAWASDLQGWQPPTDEPDPPEGWDDWPDEWPEDDEELRMALEAWAEGVAEDASAAADDLPV